MNNYNIETESISADEFARCCREEGFEKMAYIAVDQPYGNESFDEALKKVVKDDATFIRAQISAENHQQMKAMIDFFIHCVGGKVAYGIADIGPFDSIDIYMAY